ncbi:MAG: hypothetical protein ABMA02_15520 [Saprospiraceae bacterium]
MIAFFIALLCLNVVGEETLETRAQRCLGWLAVWKKINEQGEFAHVFIRGVK